VINKGAIIKSSIMKTYGILTFIVVILMLTTQCNKVECVRHCRELSELEKQLTPFQLNDIIYFTDKLDTFSIKCTLNEYTQKTDIYADHYYYDHCDGGQKTYYWELSTKFDTDINYTDSSLLVIEINTRTNYSFEEGVFSMMLYDYDWCQSNEAYSFFTRSDNSTQLFKERVSNPTLPAAYNQCDLVFYNEIIIDGYLYNDVNILFGDIENFDSVYYNNEFGIIRMVNDTIKLNILR